MAVRCGIDLGTTYSAISLYDPHSNRVDTMDLETADGTKLLRSVVYYPPGGNPVVGESAWNAARDTPDRVLVGIKRSMGTSYQTPSMDGKCFTPSEVSAEILKVLAADARTFLGEDVKDVVITVPAYFGDNERAATEEAGSLAGLNVLQLLSEPQAAAIGYAIERATEILDRHLVVCDLGGGTLDVTHVFPYLDAEDGGKLKVRTLAKVGDIQLGGLDWDRELATLVAEQVKTEHAIDLFDDAKTEAVLLDNCERAKRHLSRAPNFAIIADLAGHQVEVSVSRFEAATAHLLSRCELRLEEVLSQAKDADGEPVPRDQIEVLLAGGSTKMPMVRDMVTRVLGRPPRVYGNADLLVSAGAAYWAHLRDGGKVTVARPDAQGVPQRTQVMGGLIDVSAHAVGIKVSRPDGAGGWLSANSVVVPNGAEFGRDFKKEFQTYEHGMTEIEIVLYKGDGEEIEDRNRLMTFTIGGLPEGRPAGQRVEVTLQFDPSGVLRGSAIDLATNKSCDIVVDRSSTSP
jgi:molecular chaperone DnaK